MSKLADPVRRDWESLRPDDVVYLLAIKPTTDSRRLTNGHSAQLSPQECSGLLSLRTAEVVQILDENGRSIRESPPDQINGSGHRPRIRRLIVNIDPAAFKTDSELKEMGRTDVYESINVIVRRNQRENNFKKQLETIQGLALSDVPVPGWLQEVFLGIGDPASASYTRLSSQLKALDFRDTFVDWNHLVQSFPDRKIEPIDKDVQSCGPPYVLEASTKSAALPQKLSKKRRREDAEPGQQESESIRVSTYKPPPGGPYPTDARKTNGVRFTPVQVEAISSGTQPGLTVIVGPPGTGKTDVATQIISNIYHDFPTQRTLLIAHSNQALNQLFQKITKLDIDGRHLLRLGQGEGELETSESFSKYGRVESFLDNRTYLLAEVDRLAANFGAPGAHGSSCETADYFNAVYVQPSWSKFWAIANDSQVSASEITAAFPFHHYFHNAPQPLFPSEASNSAILEVAAGCQHHITQIFTSLEDIRPFEILRSNKDKTNYLMIKEARITAMTTTYAAIRRQEIADLGFHYDNVVMEEAAQITEIENFIPLALQNSKDGKMPLQRIVLCGDHLQNSPIIQNMAFRQFANLEQSLFLRLVRLGVPTIYLDHQGRARPSIAKLYKWRYPDLKNLPGVLSEAEYLQANAGFKYDYQFVNVPDYKGTGEAQPTPHFFQNLGEAEYAVAIYQYMRLLGYPASKISILTTYAGQRALIRDVLGHRCANNRLFGLPRLVTTVDKYQGEQNDYIILSMTRTRNPGYLRDTRRLTVALSRARLGLYILGRRSVFETSPELQEAFRLPLERPENLMLTTGEVFPTQRLLDDKIEETEMAGVEHLGQYVFEMTQAKVEMLKRGDTALPPQDQRIKMEDDGMDEPDGEMEVEQRLAEIEEIDEIT
ncbi:intron-binding protein aquarius, partial [Lecanoromycetidae sp. Uapishka_2]